MLLHPYFPKNILFFYVQNLWVMYFAATRKVDLAAGGEIYPMDTLQMLAAHWPLILHLLGGLFVFMHSRPPLSQRTRVLFPIMVVMVFLTMISKRFIEYSLPVATLFCACAFTDIFADGVAQALLPQDGVPAGALWRSGWLWWRPPAALGSRRCGSNTRI